MDELPGNLTGVFHERVLRPALQDAHRIMPRMKDRAVLRRHALKLRYWPIHIQKTNRVWYWI